uniref:HotDog ACOT-type domain-containing protein n=1 Tax=Caenorhabditis tropicalis TaxID=1561998 RepID=A0A1I7UGI8_9PELO
MLTRHVTRQFSHFRRCLIPTPVLHVLRSFSTAPLVDKMVSSTFRHVAQCQPSSFTEEDKKTKVLEPRTISHSYRKFVIPLSTDAEKQNEYLSASGSVRLGKILEDLDHMAVHVAYVHNSENGTLDEPMTLPRTIVTASVKRIDLNK